MLNSQSSPAMVNSYNNTKSWCVVTMSTHGRHETRVEKRSLLFQTTDTLGIRVTAA